MRVQVYIIAVLLGLILWVASFDMTQTAYRDAQKFGAIPNFNIRSRVHRLFHPHHRFELREQD